MADGTANATGEQIIGREVAPGEQAATRAPRKPTPKQGRAKMPEHHAPMAVDAVGLSQMLGASLRHIRRMDTAGKLPKPIRLGRSVRWPVAEVQAWLAAGAPDRRTWEAMKEGK